MKRMALALGATLLAAGLSAGDRGTPDEAKALLDKAVAKVQADGSAKALAAFNDPKGGYRDRDLYVFCFGPDRKITAHVDPKMIGMDGGQVKDAQGRPIGEEMAKMAEAGGGSIEYQYMNPVTKKVETKHSFVKKAGDQMCGVGAYKSGPES